MPRKTPQRRHSQRKPTPRRRKTRSAPRLKTRSPRRRHSKRGGSIVPVVIGGLVLGAAGAGGYYFYKRSQKAKQLFTDVSNVEYDTQTYKGTSKSSPSVLYGSDYVGVGGPAATSGPRNKKECSNYKAVSDCNSNPPCQWQSFNDDKNDPNGWCAANSPPKVGGGRRSRSQRSRRSRSSRRR